MIRNKRFLAILTLSIMISATVASTQTVTSTSAAERYNIAGELYQSGKFVEALSKYEELISEGIEHPDLFYNASNAAYRSGNIGRAILYIERSLRLDPSDSDALANRAFLNSIKQDQEPVNDNPVISFLEGTYDRINIQTAKWLSAAIFIILMLCTTAMLFTGGKIRISLIVSVCLFSFAWLFTVGLFVHKAHTMATLHEAIVMDDEVQAYSGPGIENTQIFTIHEGTKVVIEREQGDWRLIRLSSGAGGWLEAGILESLVPSE